MPIVRVALRLRTTGPRPPRSDAGLILAPNHQSWIDPVFVQFAVYPQRITFLMTELFYDLPVVGLYFRAVGARVVREEGPSVSGLRAARDALEQREVICLFPEGEITRTGEIGPGQRGVARLARRTGAPVVPVGIRGAIHVFSKLQTRPRLHPVQVRLGKPMHYTETPDREGELRFTQRLMDSIRALAEG
jgi:1-acyl-sn-glycerol-3-phosphate acyltransferase